MDFSTIITPILTIAGMAVWDLLRTFWFARYTARLTAKQMHQNTTLHCKQINQITDYHSEVKLLTTRTHSNHIIR